ncbi:hypothetical protein NGM37_19145, partial [Streptomyces sp. TRM76130]|nr:hypothetical protein [Streptomyces sp. TRM76130]
APRAPAPRAPAPRAPAPRAPAPRAPAPRAPAGRVGGGWDRPGPEGGAPPCRGGAEPYTSARRRTPRRPSNSARPRRVA